MKKILVVGALVLSVTNLMADGSQEVEARFNGLEQEFQLLMEKEQAKYNEEKVAAANAQKTLAKQKQVYAQLTAKVQQLNKIKDIKFYKSDYEGLANKFNGVLKELEGQMKEQQAIIDRFKQVEALRAGMSTDKK